MRRALVVIGSLLAVFVAALFLVPLLLKDRIVAALVEQLNARVDAEVALGDADVTLIHAFPDLTVDVSDLVVTGRGPFAGVELARVGRLGVTLDLGSVVGGGPVRVTGLSLADTRLDVRVDEEGRANTDLGGGGAAAPAAEEQAGPAPELWLRDIAIENVSVRYEDRQSDQLVEVVDLDLAGDAEVGGELVASRSRGSIGALTLRTGGTTWLSAAKVGADLDVRYGPVTGAVQIGDTTIRVNELALSMKGAVTPAPGGTDLDLALSVAPASFKGLLSLIPGAYTADFADVKVDGTVKASGTVKGLLPDVGDALPAFDLAIGVADGRFQYPGLPAAVSDIQLDLHARHPGGVADLVEIDLPRFHVAVDGSPLDGRLSLRTPTSDPAVDTQVKGRLDLGRLAAAFPDAVTGWTGALDLDVDLAGRVSEFSAGELDRVRAAGTFTLTDATWTDPTQPVPLHVDELKLSLDPRKVDLASFRLRFGASDLAASGTVENAVGWLLADEVLVGRLDARSTLLDLNPWAGGEEAPSAEGGAQPTPGDDSSLFAVPANLDLVASVDFARVLYADWDLRDVRGRARVRDGAVALEDLRTRTLGGEIALDGTYRAPTDAAADLDLRVQAIGLGAGETIAKIEAVRRILPGFEGATGKLRTGFGLKTRLGRDLRPDLATLASVGTMAAADLAVKPKFLAPVVAFLGDDAFGTLGLDGGEFGFEVAEGRLKVDRIPLKLGPAKGSLRGRTGVLDEALDLDLELAVPASAVKGGGAAKALAGGKVDTVDVVAKIGGTWKDPKVKVGLGESLRGAVEEQVAEVRAQVEERVTDTLVAEAEKAGEKLRAEAKKAADRIRSEADRQADKLEKEAKGNPLKEAAAATAARKLRSEADKKADKLEKEADAKADAGVAAAKKQQR